MPSIGMEHTHHYSVCSHALPNQSVAGVGLRQRQFSGAAVAVNGSAPVCDAGLRRLDEAAQAAFATNSRGL